MFRLLNDGYTLMATIVIDNHPPLTITYRPALAEKVYDWLAARAMTGKDRLAGVMRLLNGNLLSWDVGATEDIPHAVPCTEENWRKLPHVVLERMVDLVSGYAAGDGDPKK